MMVVIVCDKMGYDLISSMVISLKVAGKRVCGSHSDSFSPAQFPFP